MTLSLQDWLAENEQDAEFACEFRRTEALYQIGRDILHLRTQLNLTQKELAARVGTKQAGISRLENMTSPPTLSFLQRIADALNADLEIHITPRTAFKTGGDD